MGLLSRSAALTRYRVQGEISPPVVETIGKGLKHYAVADIDGEPDEKVVGWTSFENPLVPQFEGNSFVIGAYLLFSMRIDKKNLPAKIVKKYFAVELAKRLAETGREHLSRNEKQAVKERVINTLSLRIPATPSSFDVLWHYESGLLWFFSNQKASNEELETLFTKSFRLTLIRLFPYTMAELISGLSDAERNALVGLKSVRLTE
jgi:DNA recombination-dependent growth factor C